MGTMLGNESRRLYSWWWDSHISPKNSKWLQDNLTDMDAKVKSMIKLIEEDADSFARRAEMYYKKRPELMKLVEEFYRAYRALAERYDHATVELRHAHRTMAQAFPDQVPFPLGDEPQSSSTGEPRTPEMSHPIRAFLDHPDAADSATSKRDLKQLNQIFNSESLKGSEGRLSKGSSVHEAESTGQNFNDGGSEVSSGSQSLKNQVSFESERATKAESEVQSLKKTLAKVQAEKDTLLFQFQQNVEKLKNMERDLGQAQKETGRLDEQARKAEIEIKTLRESLLELEASRDAGLLRLNECLAKISNLDTLLFRAQEDGHRQGNRATKAETELQDLKQELSRLEAEKEAGLARYRHCIEMISDLESKIALTEENARSLKEHITRSVAEVEALKKALEEMTEEKEALALQYKQCIEIIAMMEAEISRAQANTERLSSEIFMGAAKLKSAEQHCAVLESSNQTLKSEADDLLHKISRKDQELSEKNDELKKFQSLMIEESSKFQQVEATLQALQKSHSQSQEDQRALALELKVGLRMLKDMEISKHGLEEEMNQVKEENKSLSELNISSDLSLKNLQDEIFSLKEMKEKLEHDVSRKEDQSNALQHEIGNLKEEINGLKDRYRLIIDQVDSVGLNPERLESSVKDLRHENLKLKEVCQRDKGEKEELYEKVKDMEKLSSENTILQNSMSGLNVELDDMREKMKKLQESCHVLEGDKSNLVAEKAALLSQLQMISENMQKLFKKNTMLESSLSGANIELEQLRIRSKSLEEMCQTLKNEKSNLLNERNSLVSQLENVEKRLGKLEVRFTKLEEKYSDLEKEKESTAFQVEELRGSLLVEKQERSSYVQSAEARLAGLQKDVLVLQEETRLGKKEFEEELDRAVNAQIEIFVLQKFIEDLEEKNYSLLVECQKHVEASKFSDKLNSELESENLEQQVEAEFLVNEIEKLRLGIHLVFRNLQLDPEKKLDQEQVSVRCILDNIEALKTSLLRSEDGEQKLMVENSVLLTLLGQIRDDGVGIESEKRDLENEFAIMKSHYLVLKKDKEELVDSNANLRAEVSKRELQEGVLKAELETLHEKMLNLQGSYIGLQEQNSKVLEENRLLLNKLSEIKEEKIALEDKNDAILDEAVALSTLSLVLESFTAEKATELKALSENLNALSEANSDLKAEIRVLRENLAKKEAENVELSDSVETLGKAFREAKDGNDQLSLQLSMEKDFSKAKSSELSEAEEKIMAAESLNQKLHRTVEELNVEFEELKLHREILAGKILELNEESSNRSKEVQSLCEEKEDLESRVGMLCKEVEKQRIREENLSSELQEKSNEFELWEAEASGFYFDLQISAVREVLLENKVQELIQVCGSLEDESSAKSMEIEQIRSKVGLLESHVGKLEAKLSGYVPVVTSLKENVASLERNARLKTKLLEARNHVKMVHRREQSEEFGEDRVTEIPDGVADLQKMQRKIKAVEKVMVEEMENLVIDSGEKAMEAEVERLAKQEKSAKSGNPNLRKPRVDTGILMKDIELDQISDFSLYGRSKPKARGGPDDQMLELWEADEKELCSHSEELDHEPTEEQRLLERALQESSSSSELYFEKDLGVIDRPFPRVHGGSGEGSKGKILERLASDAQKLTSLQRSVHDLKKKMESATTRKGKKGGNVAEFETVQMQIMEVEEAVVQLANVNGQLAKDVEESPPSPTGKGLIGGDSEAEEAGRLRRRRATEQARKGAEKIGQLQFEVQNIHYILLKLDDDEGSKGKGKTRRFAESKTGVLLRDFIYSSRRRRQRRKKGCFCGCARPATRED